MAISPPAVLINLALFFSLHTREASISDFTATQQREIPHSLLYTILYTVFESGHSGKRDKGFWMQLTYKCFIYAMVKSAHLLHWGGDGDN